MKPLSPEDQRRVHSRGRGLAHHMLVGFEKGYAGELQPELADALARGVLSAAAEWLQGLCGSKAAYDAVQTIADGLARDVGEAPRS